MADSTPSRYPLTELWNRLLRRAAHVRRGDLHGLQPSLNLLPGRVLRAVSLLKPRETQLPELLTPAIHGPTRSSTRRSTRLGCKGRDARPPEGYVHVFMVPRERPGTAAPKHTAMKDRKPTRAATVGRGPQARASPESGPTLVSPKDCSTYSVASQSNEAGRSLPPEWAGRTEIP